VGWTPLWGLSTAVLLLASSLPLLGAAVEDGYGPLDPGRQAHLVENAAELEELFERRNLRYRDPEVEALLGRIVERLQPPAPDEYINYRIHLVRDPSPMAFALADGQIYLHTGLLARLENEAQLAVALGHQIHHVAAHHHILTYRQEGNQQAGIRVAAGIADVLLMNGAFSQMAHHFAVEAKMRFSPAFEGEADRSGAQLAAAAGYDPREACRVLEFMLADPEVAAPDLPQVWATSADLRQRLDTLQCAESTAPAGKDQEAFRQLMRPLVELTVSDYIRADRPRAALGLAEMLLRRRPEPSLYIAVGDAWQALGPRSSAVPADVGEAEAKDARSAKRLTREERLQALLATEEGRAQHQDNLAHAAAAYRQALALDEALPDAHRGLGDALFASDEYRGAARSYMTYLRLAPDALDKRIVTDRLVEITHLLRQDKEETS
jgi:Zn-dependent protease with chaperone function